MNERRYGWLPDLPDSRDHAYALTVGADDLPSSVDLRERSADGFPKPFDQGRLGSCTGQAVAAVVQYLDPVHFRDSIPSRLFLYYHGRATLGTIDQDSGARIRDVIKSLNTFGVCREPNWPYAIDRFAEQPSTPAYADAKGHIAVQYERLSGTLISLKTCLAKGLPFVFGASIYTSFESQKTAKTGVITIPQTGEQLLGGHALACFGYRDEAQSFIVRNSWGPSWGQGGYCLMPYNYVANLSLCDDHWAIELMS